MIDVASCLVSATIFKRKIKGGKRGETEKWFQAKKPGI
jgi:hypothetical protein